MEWKCPKCGADPDGHGTKGPAKKVCRDRNCMGFICECDPDVSTSGDADHGQTLAKACKGANCHCCGWGGTFPKLPGKMPAWAKTALAAGWTPPEGWQP